jgi:hypothetical protein
MKRIGPWPIVVGALVSLGLFTVWSKRIQGSKAGRQPVHSPR